MAWIVTTLEKFAQYGITITTQRMLNNGEYILHFSIAEFPTFLLDCRFDESVKILTTEQMDELLALEVEVEEIKYNIKEAID